MATEKLNFCVTGMVDVVEIGPICEYVYAYSASQAIKLVVKRLKKRYPGIYIFIQDAKAEPVPPKNPSI